jgi:hypothetical protein
MLKKSNISITLAMLVLSSLPSMGASDVQATQSPDKAPATQGSKQDDTVDIQKIIDEYKTYLGTIPEDVRNEIVEFRKKIAAINKEKRDEYRKLSKASQDYLREEQKYKKRLPLDQKKLINLQTENR